MRKDAAALFLLVQLLAVCSFPKHSAASDLNFAGIEWQDSFDTVIGKLEGTGKFEINKKVLTIRFNTPSPDITLFTNLALISYPSSHAKRVELINLFNINTIEINRSQANKSNIQQCILYFTESGHLLAYRIDIDTTDHSDPTSHYAELAKKHGEPRKLADGFFKWTDGSTRLYYKEKTIRSLNYAELYYVNWERLSAQFRKAGTVAEMRAEE